MAPSAAWNPTSAVRDGPGMLGTAPTPGFHPVIAPVFVAKRNTGAPLRAPSVTAKSVALPVPLNTWPVGAPPGIATLNGWLIALPLTSPPYNSLRPVPPADTQNVPTFGARAMP